MSAGAASVTLRTASLDDLDEIMAIERATFPDDAWSRENMAAELASPHTVYTLALDARSGAGRVVGYVGLLAPEAAEQADIQTIAVRAERRGTGLGRMLLRHAIAAATQRGARELFLDVRADNDPARALYTAEGFTELGVRPRYYQPGGVDAVVMRKDLGAGS